MTYCVSRATVDAFYAAYAAQDTDRISPFFHDDIEWTISGPVDVLTWCGTYRGKAEALHLTDKVIPALFKVITFSRSSLLLDGDQVATLSRLSLSRLADGRVISYRIAHFLRFKDDKVISMLSLLDSFDAVEQMLGHALAVDTPSRTDDFVAV
ncbi:MAG: nuclear transport factor 2 family protein [Pseudolabrys sp.]|nr:nuclear transport factor 2 family protein [Pseudolabrys sp.]